MEASLTPERERERVLVLSVRALSWQLFLEGENLELSLSCILVGFDPLELKFTFYSMEVLKV